MAESDPAALRGAPLARRTLLWRASVALPLAYAITGLPRRHASAARTGFAGVIARQRHPLNAEFPFPTLDGFLTPTEQFYVRTHFEVPRLEAKQWKLTVEGHVKQPFEIGYDELRALPSRTITSVLECSGNSRVLLEPPQISIRWEQGGVSNAEWTGVALSTLLERAGVRDGAVAVILEGHDKGRFDMPEPRSPGEIRYARSLPLDKATRSEVLLAYAMNGSDLPPEHGHPVRVVVAGWYGMASVKWLRRIIVTDRPFHGYFQTFMYTTWERRHDGIPTLVPVTEIAVKSQIARPALHEVVPAGSSYRIFGAAWSGEPEIERVDVSTDGGKTWTPATLGKASLPFAWRFFEHSWSVPERRGSYVLMARATNARGEVQPMQRDEDRRDAVINHVQPIEVFIR